MVSLASVNVIIVNEHFLDCPLSHKCFWDATTGYLIYDHKLSYWQSTLLCLLCSSSLSVVPTELLPRK